MRFSSKAGSRRAKRSLPAWSTTCAAAERTRGSLGRSSRLPARWEAGHERFHRHGPPHILQARRRRVMSASHGMDRRSFFKLVGGGIVVFVSLDPSVLFSQDRQRIYPEDFNAYLLIGENGRVTVFSGKIEMGQGVMTSQAQMAAEELGVALASIDMVLGDTDKCPWDMGTLGSLTTRMFGPALRAAAAEARAVLM